MQLSLNHFEKEKLGYYNQGNFSLEGKIQIRFFLSIGSGSGFSRVMDPDPINIKPGPQRLQTLCLYIFWIDCQVYTSNYAISAFGNCAHFDGISLACQRVVMGQWHSSRDVSCPDNREKKVLKLNLTSTNVKFNKYRWDSLEISSIE